MRFVIAVGLFALVTALPCLAADEDAWSTVKGKVIFDDSKQKIPQRVIPPGAKGANLPPCAAKDPDFLTEEWIVDPKTKAVKNVIVWLTPEPTANDWKRLKATGPNRLKEFPSFKPAQVRFTHSLPKTRSAKVLRRAIRAVVTGDPPGDLSGLEDPASLDAIAAAS